MKLHLLLALSFLSLPALAQEHEEADTETIEYSFERSAHDKFPLTDDKEAYVLEGDIAYRINRSAGHPNAVLWPKGVLIYEFQNKGGNFVSVVEEAMQYIEAKTKLRFKQRTTEKDYVLIGSSQAGCFSYFGRIGGAQVLNLQENGCVHRGVAVHEFLHAFGILHEQSRFDRDQYVTIHEQNMQPGMQSQFSVMKHLGSGSYDYQSIMHYGSEFFSRNGRPTITKKDGSLITANRDYLTAKDIDGLHELYENQLEGGIIRPTANLQCDTDVTFVDSKHFDSRLRGELDAATNVCVKFSGQTYISTQMPERLEKWLSAIKESNGKVEYQEVSRGWLSKLIEFIFNLFRIEFDKYGPAKKYNALVQIDKDSKQVITVIFYPRK